VTSAATGRRRIHLIAAARPNFMKIAPLYHALRPFAWCEPRIIHTGQHYDANMSQAFFDDLRLPPPDAHLEVGSGTHAEQTGNVMISYERVAMGERPDWIVVVGDVNSTAACALVGSKLGVPVVHLEAGLRSRDRRMPEEINRLVTDAVSDVLWTPSPDADANLRAEGVDPAKIDRVGNIMIDSYEMLRPAIEASGARARLGLTAGQYGVVTLHRPSNVDAPVVLAQLVEELAALGRELPLLFAVHPRTRRRLEEFQLLDKLRQAKGIILAEPMGYVDFMNLVVTARLAVTDSGGVQEETTYLGIPCVTLRENTERPITITEGTNRLAGISELGRVARAALATPRGAARRPALWDGQAAQRCAAALARRSGL
jgi:UDP-N-acetylglucosamine 2-epimerase (non-hydrolysing)